MDGSVRGASRQKSTPRAFLLLIWLSILWSVIAIYIATIIQGAALSGGGNAPESNGGVAVRSPPTPPVAPDSGPARFESLYSTGGDGAPPPRPRATSHFCHSRDFVADNWKRASCAFRGLCFAPVGEGNASRPEWWYIADEAPAGRTDETNATDAAIRGGDADFVDDASFTLGVGPHSVDKKVQVRPRRISAAAFRRLHPTYETVKGTSVAFYEFNSENFGHMLTDVLLPIYIDLLSFGKVSEDGTTIEKDVSLFRYLLGSASMGYSCEFQVQHNMGKGQAAKNCARFQRMMEQLFHGVGSDPDKKKTRTFDAQSAPICFNELVVGMSMYSDDCLEYSHGKVQDRWWLCNHGWQDHFWSFRNFVLRNAGVRRPADPPHRHKVIFTRRDSGPSLAGRRRDVLNLDELVGAVKRAFPNVEVAVVQWHDLSLTEQFATISNTTVLITPPGGVSFIQMFMPRWATSIRVYKIDFRMEWHIFNYLGHVKSEYVQASSTGNVDVDQIVGLVEGGIRRYESFFLE